MENLPTPAKSLRLLLVFSQIANSAIQEAPQTLSCVDYDVEGLPISDRSLSYAPQLIGKVEDGGIFYLRGINDQATSFGLTVALLRIWLLGRAFAHG